MRLVLPEKVREKLSTIISFVVIVILIIALIYIFPLLTTSIPPNRSEWAYEATQITELNDLGLKGEGVTIAIIDTGIDLKHPDLRSVRLVAWRDLVNRELDPYDDDGHGTAMAGIIAGKKFGVAPKAGLIVVKAIPKDGGASDTTLLTAIRYCIQQGADIISMSLGRYEFRVEDLTGPWQDSNLETVCNEAIEAGIFLVAAAGNDGGENDDGEVDVPGIHDKAISVGAINENLAMASFSSEGENDGKVPNLIIDWDPWERHDPDKKPEVVAPGVEIVAPGLKQNYYKYDGTSLSVPFVSGALGLILSELPQYQHENNSGEADITKVKEALMGTSKKIASYDVVHSDKAGYGLLQANDLYLELKGIE